MSPSTSRRRMTALNRRISPFEVERRLRTSLMWCKSSTTALAAEAVARRRAAICSLEMDTRFAHPENEATSQHENAQSTKTYATAATAARAAKQPHHDALVAKRSPSGSLSPKNSSSSIALRHSVSNSAELRSGFADASKTARSRIPWEAKLSPPGHRWTILPRSSYPSSRSATPFSSSSTTRRDILHAF